MDGGAFVLGALVGSYALTQTISNFLGRIGPILFHSIVTFASDCKPGHVF